MCGGQRDTLVIFLNHAPLYCQYLCVCVCTRVCGCTRRVGVQLCVGFCVDATFQLVWENSNKCQSWIEDDLQRVTLLPQPNKCWSYRCSLQVWNPQMPEVDTECLSRLLSHGLLWNLELINLARLTGPCLRLSCHTPQLWSSSSVHGCGRCTHRNSHLSSKHFGRGSVSPLLPSACS